MKAAMDANGVITIKAESELESFALGAWARKAVIDVTASPSLNLQEDSLIRGRYVVIDASVPQS
jgi:hypothetical protein